MGENMIRENMSRLPLAQPSLCLITDPSLPDLIARMLLALQAGVTMVQLRGHTLSASALYRLGCDLRALCDAHGAILIVNDRVDVALACAADGVQLGVRSLPIQSARQIIGPERIIGASVHSLTEAQQAHAEGADFLLVGTIFASQSHPGEVPAGLPLLRSIREALPTSTLLAIGGITSANAPSVQQAGADGVATISAILHSPDITQAVCDIQNVLQPALPFSATEKE